VVVTSRDEAMASGHTPIDTAPPARLCEATPVIPCKLRQRRTVDSAVAGGHALKKPTRSKRL
jgi:hypothetical protein